MAFRIGYGYDVHQLAEGESFWLGGIEVPHTHVHVVPMRSMADLDFANADEDADADELDAHLASLRAALEGGGHSSVSTR